MTIDEAEMREEKAYTGRYSSQIARLKLLLRTLAIFLPIALFGAAILVGLVFWVTLIPVLGTIAVVLTIAGTILSLLAAFIFFKP
ncbi:MAG TPA: hypothetical protein VGA03_11025 [Anaerolineales bacterium]|jgi:mannose/fructose/N-acetylgalactosamine-specific phosphotransferase system component IID